MNEGFLGVVRLISVALQNVSFAVLIGAMLSDMWLSRRASRWQSGVSRRLLTTMRISALVVLLSSFAAFWAHCALMSESSLFEAGPAVVSMLKETGFGHAWLVNCVLLLIVFLLLLVNVHKRGPYAVVIALATAGAALARSNTGHPVDAGTFSPPVWADWVHVLAISVWVGLVLVAASIVVPRIGKAPEDDAPNSAAFVQSLSNAATVALAMLAITGTYNGWRGVNSPVNLWTSTYGQVLVLKLALVLIAAALGGHNRIVEMPKVLMSLKGSHAMQSRVALKRFARVLQVESVVLAGVLIVAAVLVSSPLPGTSS
ncbi:copper resistance D family protein [Paraburkholderia sp. RCC_158]|uniref:copper resistance D family protein n=1 Tax=Paraburkholderia sp. RCC_158 TaxID=3239220 RepID=UPI003523117D